MNWRCPGGFAEAPGRRMLDRGSDGAAGWFGICRGLLCAYTAGGRWKTLGWGGQFLARWLLAAGCWLLVAGCWLLAVGCWLLGCCLSALAPVPF
ncbi:MAG: hypothetical protein EPO12_00305 [Aquabacterium sp.]|nr:MAG: hypothetical protein EPO12_00305 [Aquabacterium sp.]